MTITTRLCRLYRCRSGAAAIEFAFIASIVILLVVGLVQAGHGLQIRNDLVHAADRGSRLALVKPDASNADLEREIRSVLGRYDPDRLVISAPVEQVIGGTTFRVLSVRYLFTLMLPGVSVGSITLQASRRIPVS